MPGADPRYPEPPKLAISPDEDRARVRERVGALLLSELNGLESCIGVALASSDSQLGTELAETMARLRVDVRRWVRTHSPGWDIKEVSPPSSVP